ncbi:MAG: transglutaminase family protein [Rubrivivax sp.]|jgi:transglutaminase-like putative cysteine protease|nr:transglutaminase family protein [Betaproteobacteria bacterium]MBP6318810.1 transglutaminase family protein [Rubrivivax sp.]MBK7278030.1 transglutaminase family protein [Betaproteobacteria bacterium]MBK7457039.1 transglutaminase family protein [Betaproteobacteria bacterium]MBK7518244.1 transglutaminase family protein [Betaproteobacteria bacterium]
MLLEIFHETRYDYAAPVTLAHHLAHLQPLEDAHQQLLAFDLDIDPVPAQRRDSRDAMGNAQRHFSLLLPHARLHVRASSRVRVQARFAGLQPALSPAWDEVAQSLRYVARAPFRPEVEFAMPSPYVPRLGVLREFAAPSLPPGRPLAEAALELMHRIHTGFAYDSASTEIDTPLAQVVAQRRGVCQDFAHLMAGALRMWGLPARYVSGYLLTQAPEGGAQMLGADASHAWVQVWCPGTPGVAAAGPGAGWLDLDPTNDLVPGSGHVRLAVGRDYADVTPLRGVIRGGGGSHTLNVAVRTRVVEAAADAAPEAGPRLAIVHSQES